MVILSENQCYLLNAIRVFDSCLWLVALISESIEINSFHHCTRAFWYAGQKCSCHNVVFKNLFYLKCRDTGGERWGPSICWVIPQVPLKPRTKNSIRVSHLGSWDPSTCAVMCYFPESDLAESWKAKVEQLSNTVCDAQSFYILTGVNVI